jgi:hypothetical protein
LRDIEIRDRAAATAASAASRVFVHASAKGKTSSTCEAMQKSSSAPRRAVSEVETHVSTRADITWLNDEVGKMANMGTCVSILL